MRRTLTALSLTGALCGASVVALQPPQAPPAGTPPPQQQSDIQLTISGEPGAPPKYAVPDFIAMSGDAESRAAAKTIGEVLWADLDFELEFYMIPRDT